jgi:hypothetical protein
MINGDSTDAEISLDCRGVVARAVSQKDPRPFGFPHWCNTRSLQSFKSIFFLWREGQRWEFGFSSHAPKDNRPVGSVNVLVKRYTRHQRGDEHREQGLEPGAADFIKKPFGAEDFISRILSVVEETTLA